MAYLVKPPTRISLRRRADCILASGYFRPDLSSSRVYVICPNGCGQVEAYVDIPFSVTQGTKALRVALIDHLRGDALEQRAGDRA